MADSIVTQITIIKGSDRVFSVRVVSQESGDPFDFTGVEEIKAIFQQEVQSPPIDPVEISLTGTEIVPVTGNQGKLTLTLSEAKTANLLVSDSASFELLISMPGGQLTIVQFVGAINAVARLFPGVS